MSLADKTQMRFCTIQPWLTGTYLSRMSVNPSLRGSREKLLEFDERIRAGGILTESEIVWVDWLSRQITHYLKTGNLIGKLVEIDGVWRYEVDGEGVTMLAKIDKPFTQPIEPATYD